MLNRNLFGITLALSGFFVVSGSVNLAEARGLRHRCCVPVCQPVPCPVVVVAQPRVVSRSVVRATPVTRAMPTTSFATPVASPMVRRPVAPAGGFGQQGFGQQGFGQQGFGSQGFGQGGPQLVRRTYKITKIRYKVPKKPVVCPPVKVVCPPVNCCPPVCPPVQIICPPICAPVCVPVCPPVCVPVICPPVECSPCKVRSPRYCVPRKKFFSKRRAC